MSCIDPFVVSEVFFSEHETYFSSFTGRSSDFLWFNFVMERNQFNYTIDELSLTGQSFLDLFYETGILDATERDSHSHICLDSIKKFSLTGSNIITNLLKLANRNTNQITTDFGLYLQSLGTVFVKYVRYPTTNMLEGVYFSVDSVN
jgi:hypothetical protein